MRVLLYEDNTDLREELADLLSSTDGILFLGGHTNCKSTARHMAEEAPDVVLMDIDMPEVNGLAGLQTIKSLRPETHVLMLTVFEDNESVFKAICLGADGYLLKSTPPDKILAAIRDVADGGAPMTSTIAKKVLQLFPRSSPNLTTQNPPLTDKEREVLQLLVQGHSYKTAAAALHISIETIRNHIKKIYSKLQVHSMSEAVVKAMREKLV